jgi:cytochrome c553
MQLHTKIGRGYSIAMLVFTVLLSSNAAANAKTTNLYQIKCSSCHGKNGEGKPSMKVPSLVSDDAKKLPDDQMRQLIVSRANGEMERNASHEFLKKRLTEDQVQEIINHIRKMQRKHH